MSNASTKKAGIASATDDEMPALTAERFRVRGRGRNAGKRLALPLAGIRKAAGKTQLELAAASGMAQGDVSRLEGQDDMLLSTLNRYAEALGAELEVSFTFPDGARVYLGKR
jgi:hypothetical protein